MGPKGRWVEFRCVVNVWMKLPKSMQHITNIKWSYRRKWLDVWLNLLKEALENSESSAVDFVEDFKMNLYSKEIYILHKGDIKSLPKGATSLDFVAYTQKSG
jgi:GTP pyrophosphokinase